MWERRPEVFDEVGTALLAAPGPFDLLLMDELGRLELGAAAFRASVLAAWTGRCRCWAW